MEQLEIAKWVAEVAPAHREFREAVHVILSAIAKSPYLKTNMIIKGGILLAIRYQSSRYTKDIDFSTSKTLQEFDKDGFLEKFRESLMIAVNELDYGMDCRVQSYRIEPKNRPNAHFPSVEMSVGYARKGSKEHKRLVAGQCPHAVKIDYNLNEFTDEIENIAINDGSELAAYSFHDLVAEKYRAILQQEKRKRYRRQDVFDLYLLFTTCPSVSAEEEKNILGVFKKKSASRDLEVNQQSMQNPAIKEHSRKYYSTLAIEIEEELPNFDMIYGVVQRFYENLPWGRFEIKATGRKENEAKKK